MFFLLAYSKFWSEKKTLTILKKKKEKKNGCT